MAVPPPCPPKPWRSRSFALTGWAGRSPLYSLMVRRRAAPSRTMRPDHGLILRDALRAPQDEGIRLTPPHPLEEPRDLRRRPIRIPAMREVSDAVEHLQ